MSTLDAIKQEDESLLFKTYGRYPAAIERGFGSRLWDFDGKEYIDLLAGIAVTSLGHCHPELVEVMTEQSHKLIHISNLLYQKEVLALAERLLATAHCGKVFFCNSGAEANEAAIKLARRYQQKVKNRNAYEIITFEGCFHGRTLATVAATGQAKFQDGFSPMPEGFNQIPYGDPALLETAISDKTAAVMLEMVQGEGGIRPVTPEFVKGVARVCKERNVLFIADEVQAGLCRTGKWWSFQHFGIQPDIVTIAKSLANGLPMGAMMGTDELAEGFAPGTHATTFGGAPLLSAVACKVLEIMERDRLMERAATLGAWGMERFRQVGENCPGCIKEVRGMGLMIGIELALPGKEVWETLLRKGFILNLTQEKVLRLLPALNIEQDDLERFALALEAALKQQRQGSADL